MLQKFFFKRSTNIFQGLIDNIKFFDRKTVKISYSSMQNMSKIYKGHNSKITFTSWNQLTLCNCWVKEECPMDGRCQTMDAVYNCSVTSPGSQKITLDWQKENERRGILAIKIYSITKDIHMRRRFQVICGI